MLKGLQYVGNGRGLSVMLYRSYKSVIVSWDKPYAFTNKDIVNDDAKKYYSRNYGPLGIKLVEDNTILPELDASKVEDSAVATVDTKEEPTPQPVAEDTSDSEVLPAEELAEAKEDQEVASVAEDTSDAAYPVLMEILASIKEEYGPETISSINESDLCSLLDERLDDERVKELAALVGYSIGRTKNKYKIISGLASSDLQRVVNLILA